MSEQTSLRSILAKHKAAPTAETLAEILSATGNAQNLSVLVGDTGVDMDGLLSDVAALAGILPVIVSVNLVGVIGQVMWIANSAIALAEEYRADALLAALLPEETDNEPAS